jgi:hypothetical protein
VRVARRDITYSSRTQFLPGGLLKGIIVTLVFLIVGCSSDAEVRAHAQFASEQAAAAEAPYTPSAGTARVTLTGDDISVEGTFPAGLCGGPYMLGQGMAFQTQAGDWKITIASDERLSGNVELNQTDGSVRVVATANGPGKQFVRGPRNTGSLVVSPNFKQAKADLELRPVVGRGTAHLVVVFQCNESG